MAVTIAQGILSIGLALLFVAFVWWVFQVEVHPDWTIFDAVRVVLLLSVLLVIVGAVVFFIRQP
jgi:hypothetical protein